MSSTSVFSKSILKTKKKNKLKLLFLFTKRIIQNNRKLFFFCSLLAVITAIINFNIGVSFKNAFFVDEKTLSNEIIEDIKKEKTNDKGEIEIKKIEDIAKNKATTNAKLQTKVKEEILAELKKKGNNNQNFLKREEAIKLIKEASKDNLTTIFRMDNFKFKFNLFGWELFKRENLGVWEFIARVLLLIFAAKSTFSLLHYYLMNYSYDIIERNLKKDLFKHFIRAKYTNSSEVSRNLLTQFATDLDSIAFSSWFIPNRLIYVFFFIIYTILFDFNFGNEGINKGFIAIIFSLFGLLMIIEIILFRKAGKLSIAAKKRYEEDNKVIYERINNLEYIKAVSGEKYEERKIDQQLNSTFEKNKRSLWYSVLFKALPNYIVIPNIPIFFVSLALASAEFGLKDKNDSAFLATNFILYYMTAQKLNSEVNKIVDALLTLEELSSNLIIVNESAKVLNKSNNANLPVVSTRNIPFENGDIVFQNVVFAYPKRPTQNILKNFSFSFIQGKSYGIAGKNGIGKSTITKTTLKLYDLKEGGIIINNRNIQEINTASLHQRICYQTNRPTFFKMSIAENVFYPYSYKKENDLSKLVKASKKVGIYEFIKKLPNEFDTELREGGTDLSEGQKQQITAMKMFINEYDIYILDEILSNVHPLLKETVLKNIFAQIKNKTILVIDHHYGIFQYVDDVYQFTGEKLIKMDKQELLPS